MSIAAAQIVSMLICIGGVTISFVVWRFELQAYAPRRLGLFVVLIGAVGLLSTFFHENWDSRFLNTEYELTFNRPDGQPIQGVELRVTSIDGEIRSNFPVTDFSSGNIPKSDSAGVMRFHHVGHGLEFGGDRSNWFFFIPIGVTGPPDFTLTFLYAGQEVGRCMFSELNSMAGFPSIQREWKTGQEKRTISFAVVRRSFVVQP
jgi:hypothetical protein